MPLRKSLQVNVGVLFPGSGYLLVLQDLEGLADILSCVAGHDHIVCIAPFRRLIGVFVLDPVLVDQCLGSFFGIRSGLYLLAKMTLAAVSAPTMLTLAVGQAYIRSARCSYRAWRSVHPHTTSDDHADQRNGCLSPGIEGFCPVAQDALPLVRGADPEGRTVGEGHKRDIEQIAEADEPCQLVSGVAVECSCKNLGLVATIPAAMPLNRAKPTIRFRAKYL